MSQYVCGYDYGTLSCRISVCELSTGRCVFEDSMDYPHGVMTEMLGNRPLAPGWALQDPDDYLQVMAHLTHQATRQINPKEIVAIGTDFTNCTVVPVDAGGKPLCASLPTHPHAWVKLWKHHAAQPQADRIAKVLGEQQIPWFDQYGHSVSSEWLFPKLLEIYENDRTVYDAAALFLEAADYITYWLSGQVTRNLSTLGVNAFYAPERGYPSHELLESFAEGFGGVLDKLGGRVAPVGSRAGTLCPDAAERLGLPETVVVSTGHGDSEIAAAGLGITESGAMLMVMGTSTCYQMQHRSCQPLDGICAVMEGGMLPELFAYESGQPAVGDLFAWFAENMMPDSYAQAAKAEGLSKLVYLGELCGKLKAGESGLVALDWFNGNRSVLMNFDLSGSILGLTLRTRPEEIYRALVEATAFGARRIFDSYNDAGLSIGKVYAVGGLAQKSAVIMQIYADVLGCPLIVPSMDNASTMGGCVCAAVALEHDIGTLDAFADVCGRMVHYNQTLYTPNPEAVQIYDQLYDVWRELHDFVGLHSTACQKLRSIADRRKG